MAVAEVVLVIQVAVAEVVVVLQAEAAVTRVRPKVNSRAIVAGPKGSHKEIAHLTAEVLLAQVGVEVVVRTRVTFRMRDPKGPVLAAVSRGTKKRTK